MGNTVRASVYVLSAALIGGSSVTALESQRFPRQDRRSNPRDCGAGRDTSIPYVPATGFTDGTAGASPDTSRLTRR
jgi:hypothetical protein